MIRFNAAAPTFAVADVGATIRWYRDQLGFAADHFPAAEPFAWASLQRDGVEFMLLRVEGYRKPDLSALHAEGLWDAYVRVRGVKELYDRLKEQNFVVSPLVKHFYGDWEFEVRDPNGYVLVFSELTE